MSQKKFEIFPIRKNIFSQLSIVVAWRLQKEPKFYVGVDSIKFVSVRKHTVPGWDTAQDRASSEPPPNPPWTSGRTQGKN